MKKPFGLSIAGIVLLFLFVFAGCSSGTSPLDPDSSEPAYLPQVENQGGCFLWGLWNVTINTETEAIEIANARIADGCLNVLGFLEPPALSNLNIANLQLLPAQNRVNVDVILTHPFSTNGQFHGFDVKGVVFGPTLLNADGLTAWMNPSDFSGVGFGYIDGLLGTPHSTAFYSGSDWGYKYFADGLGKNDSLVNFFTLSSNLNNRGMFSEGQSNTRRYELDFGTPSKFLIFNYAVVANYDWPTGTPPYDKSDFAIAKANCQEAFCMAAYEVTNYLWYDTNAGIGGGTLDLDVEVWDWQGLSNTSVTVSGPALPATTVSTYSSGSTARSGIFSFAALTPSIGSPNPITLTISATDSSASFGSSWFMGLLPISNSKYSTKVYMKIIKPVNVTAVKNYYNTTSMSDFVLWPYPHQSLKCCFQFVDYYNFLGPPYGRHDISVYDGPGTGGLNTVKVIDTVGVGPAGPPPPGGGLVYDFPLPIGSALPIPLPYFAGATPPNLGMPWEPTRFDGTMTWETQICSANVNPYVFSPWPAPEYSIIQVYHLPPGAGGPPFLADMDPTTPPFPVAPFYFIGVDVTNGFYVGPQPGALYGVFFFDYGVWGPCGYPFPPMGPPGVCLIYELPAPLIPGLVRVIPLPTSLGVPGPGPNVIDDSSVFGVCGSLAVDSTPINQSGLTLPMPKLVYILDSEGDIEIFEVDFTAGLWAPYGCISAAFMGPGNMAADIEMIDSSKVAALGLPGYVPKKNMLAVAMVDGNPGPNQGNWWVDIYTINKGLDTSKLHASTPVNNGQPFLALDIDETTGEIYVLHGSNSAPGNTAISVYKYI